MRDYRRNPDAPDFDKALRKYVEFNQLEPRKILKSTDEIPEAVHLGGDAQFVSYRSDKWTGEHENYMHNHNGGVKVYLTRPRDVLKSNGHLDRQVEVPSSIRHAKALVRLGYCLGIGYVGPDGVRVEALGYKQRAGDRGFADFWDVRDPESVEVVEGSPIDVATKDLQTDLYCTPTGNALIVIDRKTKLVQMLIWGGWLDVLDKGIVG